MSINITVQGNPVKCSKVKKFLLNEERVKNDLIQERKKLRLEQVRAKSKELASQLRKNVETEKRKQLEKIDDIKQRELQNWRNKVIIQKQNEFQDCVANVGEAHRAAEAENSTEKCSRPHSIASATTPRKKCEKWVDICPTEPTPKKRKGPAQNMTYKHFCQERAKRAKKNIGKENLSKLANDAHKTRTKKYNACSENYNEAETDESSSPRSKTPAISENALHRNVCSPNSPSSSSDCRAKVSAHPTYKRPRSSLLHRKKSKSKLVKTPSVILEIDSECDSSEVDVDDVHQDTNMKFSKVSSKEAKRSDSPCGGYNPSDYKASDSPVDQICARKSRFTQISDLIKQHDDINKNNDAKENDSIKTICFQLQEKSPTRSGSPNKTGTESACNQTKSPDKLKLNPNLKSTSKSTLKSHSQLQSNNRVQFYDYWNKFEKRYDHPNVVRAEQDKGQLNAMQQAELEIQARASHLEELDKLRQKCEARSQKALEKEQIRRDCEALTAKLDALTKGKTISQGATDDAFLFSDSRFKQMATERQNKMNSAVEDILKRPVVITCPEVDSRSKTAYVDSVKKPSASDINLGAYPAKNSSISLNSSDSCVSILLNYVDSQSKLIADDIDNCDNSEKIRKLKELLDKINCLRKKLLEEIERTKEKERNSDIQDVVEDITALRKEREKIVLGEAKEKNLEQREKKLRRKEALLEKKLREFYEMAKSDARQSSPPAQLQTNKPVEIIIKVKDHLQKKSPYKSPRKRSSLIQTESRKKIKTPQKKKNVLVEKHVQTTPQSEEISSSTSYRSPPTAIGTLLTAALEKTAETKPAGISGRNKGVQVASISKESSKAIDLSVPSLAARKKTRNPLLEHYVQRLLGMSRHSIEMLNVSSSDIETPSSSIVNTPANKPMRKFDAGQQERLDRLERFIKDNYSLISEVEESLKMDKSSSSDSSLKAIEEIWRRILKRKEKEREIEKQTKILKPILKKDKQIMDGKKSSPDKVTAGSRKSEGQGADPDKIELVSKYNELTNSCTQRIAELTEMINKVREEKQKILEITLSSGSASARSTTEYAEFPDRYADKTVESDQSSKIRDERIIVEDTDKVRLEKNKLTGMSRDSGISMSRPATALDFRESPAVQTTDKASPSVPEIFEPLLKDIPKPNKVASVPPLVSQATLQKSLEIAGDKSKKGRPPVSIARFSPQLVEDVPHELSTILEVDTSATSRSLVPKSDKLTAMPRLEAEQTTEKMTYVKFPTFEEYARKHQLELSQLDPDMSSKLQLELQELLRISERTENLRYKEFSSEQKDVENEDDDAQEHVDSLIQSLKLLNLSMKRFPTHREYLEKLGTSNLINSKSLESSGSSGKSNGIHSITSVESLPDVVEELIRRKIIKHSFRNENGDAGEDIMHSAEKSTQLSKETSSQSKVKSSSKGSEKVSAESEAQQHRDDGLLSGVEIIPTSSNQSNSDNIEKDLDKMGLKWASLMLKKSQKCQEIGTSSTSSSFMYTNKKRSPKKNDQSKRNESRSQNASQSMISPSQSLSEGRPLNLKEFLAKELQKRTQLSSTSSLTEDSIASQILRSLLGSGNSTPTPAQLSSNEAPNSEQPNRILTSTPVLTRSNSPSKPSNSTGSQRPFVAESLSSVRYSQSGSESKSNSDPNHIENVDDNLASSNLKRKCDQSIDYFEY